jgi:prepilin-type N-terminal cleavage/methylation domain-containing protein
VKRTLLRTREVGNIESMRKNRIVSSHGFSLIEMIGVLAIIGILASVVAPKVFDAIRDAKITGAVGVLQTIKSSAVDYARKYNNIPTDGTKTPGDTTFARPYGDSAVITSANSTYGDLLIYEGILDKLVAPIGPNGKIAYTTASITLVSTGVAKAKPANTGAIDYPMVFCRSYGSLTEPTRLFSSAQNSTRVVFMLIPGLTTLEAAGLKTKIDGPFNETIVGPSDLVTKTVAGTGTGAVEESVNRGNCLLTTGTSSVGGFDAWCYVAHE